MAGTDTVVDGYLVVGDFVKTQSNCYICKCSKIRNRVFLGPNVVFTDDGYPRRMRDRFRLEGPIIGDFVTLGGGCV